MLQAVVITVILTPSFNLIWTALSYFGFISTVALLVGYLLYYRQSKTIPKTKIRSVQLSVKKSRSFERRPDLTFLAQQISTIGKEFIRKNVTSPFVLSALEIMSSSREMSTPAYSALDSSIDALSTSANNLLKALSTHPLFDLICLNSLAVAQDHIKLYKKYRLEYLSSHTSLQPLKLDEARHIDDFNDFSKEVDDISNSWAKYVDDLNRNIVARLKIEGKLHPSVGKSIQAEQDHLRSAFKIILKFLKEKYPAYLPSKNKILQVIVREWSVNQFIHPVLTRLCNPDIINSTILEKCSRKLLIQKAVKQFRHALDLNFTVYPPIFLISHYTPQKFILSEKLKYTEPLLKYSKKVTSVVDLQAVRQAAIKELRRRPEDISDDYDNDIDGMNRYLKSLSVLKRKVEKRLGYLEEFKTFKSMKAFKPPRLRISKISEEYYKSCNESGPIGLSLHYFLEFLSTRQDFEKSMRFLRFCAVADKYRQLVWRLNTGVTDSNPASLNLTLKAFPIEFSKDSHSRFQKEVLKIYEKNLKGDLEGLLPTDISRSFHRYMTSTVEADDYLCVLNAQGFFIDELEDLFTEFTHSESFFKWNGEYARVKIIQSESYQYESYLEVFDGSAMMNGMENELAEACMKLTGQSRDAKDDDSDVEKHTQSLIITLDSLFDGNVVNPVTATPATLKDDDDDDEIHAPGEMFDNSKLSLVQESIERYYLELDVVNLLLSKFMDPGQDPLLLMQYQILIQTKLHLSLEIADLVKQKAKFERQNEKEAEALMPGQCFVNIQEVVPSADMGKVVTYFLVQIEQRHLNTGWAVKRRYSDFDSLHRRLREKFSIVDDFDFPAKSSVLWARVRSDTKARAKGLEKYLQRVIDSKDISKSDHVRNFLSSSFKPEKLKTRLFHFEFDQDVQDGLNGLKKLNASKIAEGLAKLGGKNGNNLFGKKKSPSDEDLAALAAESVEELDSDEDIYSDDAGDMDSSLLKPNGPLVTAINNLTLEIFDMKECNDWLKENASLLLLDQLLANNGHLESTVDQWAKTFLSDDNLVEWLKRYKHVFVNPQQLKDITISQNSTSLRIDAKIKFLSAFSDVISRSLGAELCTKSIIMAFEMLQNDTLNKHLIFTQLDMLVELIQNSL